MAELHYIHDFCIQVSTSYHSEYLCCSTNSILEVALLEKYYVHVTQVVYADIRMLLYVHTKCLLHVTLTWYKYVSYEIHALYTCIGLALYMHWSCTADMYLTCLMYICTASISNMLDFNQITYLVPNRNQCYK